MADELGVRAGVRRSVHALIQTLGATAVQLQVSLPPVAGDSGEELGLRAPDFQTKVLDPVAVRRGSTSVDLLVAADVLEALLGVTDPGAIATAVETVAAVQIADETFVPTATETVPCRGGACMYRILLRLKNAEAA